ncbi:hypothetical protein ALP39_200173 [Pseudomonas marginalis pv. marginalis]|nr:hypothetical protein ALP39_200173 [Pseudomonas marginalis pv. marginalis]
MTGVLSRLERDGLVRRQKSSHGVHCSRKSLCCFCASLCEKLTEFKLTRAVSDGLNQCFHPGGELMFSLPMHCGSSSMIGLSWKRWTEKRLLVAQIFLEFRNSASIMPLTALASSTSRRKRAEFSSSSSVVWVSLAPMALSPIAIPVCIEPVNETLSVPGGSTKPLPTRAATDQNVQRTRGNIGFNCQFGVLRNGKISLSKAWGQMLHVLMDQLRRDGLDSQDSIDEGKAVQ